MKVLQIFLVWELRKVCEKKYNGKFTEEQQKDWKNLQKFMRKMESAKVCVKENFCRKTERKKISAAHIAFFLTRLFLVGTFCEAISDWKSLPITLLYKIKISSLH